MSDSFKKREKSYEAKYKMDQELAFKVSARRNKLLGLWLAKKFGLESGAAENYAKDVVIADLTEPGDEDVIRKVMHDIAEKGLDVSEEAVREKLEMLEGAAYNEIKSEYPEALEADHEGTTG